MEQGQVGERKGAEADTKQKTPSRSYRGRNGVKMDPHQNLAIEPYPTGLD